jgi:membrane-bound lytic murein transglycosylase B
MVHDTTSMRPNLTVILALIVIALTLVLLDTGTAADGSVPDSLFDSLRRQLAREGFDPEQIDRLYARPEVDFETRGVSLFFVHSEARLNYDQFLSPPRILKAREYLDTHHDALTTTENVYGVDKAVITAILLVETQLGTITGSQSVLNILSTMASLSDTRVRERFWADIDPERRLPRQDFDTKADRKSTWAFGELKSLLLFVEREGFDPTRIPGSYAGAMGICQFMPSNAMTLAVDGNGDGRVDLFDHADAIASVGNYLRHHGWHTTISDDKAYKVILRYNYSKPYANTVLKIAERLRD